ncbi:MAG: GntR family transcriptional regulator [Betaproteobacteria bacterium]|jgi:DNA-binding GntR family transcriptional regulator|nr:GntR family transcriptional regulator [Betaproteobacteria bacterium]MBK8320131.1 GntR family transcriptional regulator [Betaproteobacteria bacterium]MBK9782789.1 GntR family transcriptional regulator [Candidatus Dechloromonas phosphorivorans]
MTRIAPTALYQEVAERLRQRIFAHELTPGDWIDEQKLAEQYGISRTPLREALKVLAAEGLVDLKPRRGCYVTEISRQDIDDIFPLMAMLEGRCAFIAVQLAKPEDIRDLKAIHEKLELAAKESRIDAFFEANQEFHRRIQELTNNRWLLSVIQDLRKVLKLSRLHSLSLEGRLQQSLEEHRVIMAAFEAGDAEKAEKSMHDHLLYGREALAKMDDSAPKKAG